MGIQVVRIEVDVHEPDTIRDALRLLGVQAETSSLLVGDYRFPHSLVERKTVPDLHSTLAAGRLFGVSSADSALRRGIRSCS